MSKYATTIIKNGLRTKGQDFSRLEGVIKENSHIHSINSTQKPEEMRAIITENFHDDYFNIFGFVGGDGTQHYAVNEMVPLIDKGNFVMAAIPYKHHKIGKKSGNDLSRPAFNIDNREEGIDALSDFYKNPENIVNVDVGLLQIKDDAGKLIFERYFINTVGGGQSAVANKIRKEYGIPYTPAGILAALKGPTKMVINIDGTDHVFSPDYRERMVNVNNTTDFGNKIYIAPDADVSDGFFNATIVENCNFFKVLYLLAMAKARKDVVRKSNKIHYFNNVKELTIKRKTHFPIQLDGEDFDIKYPDSYNSLEYSIQHTGMQLPFVTRKERKKK